MSRGLVAVVLLSSAVVVPACARVSGTSRPVVLDQGGVPSSDRVFAEFQRRAGQYMTLHRDLSAGIPAEKSSTVGGSDQQSADALARRIRAARAAAKQGDLFTAPVVTRLRERLNPVLRGAAARDARAVIRDDAPPPFTLGVNDAYPEGAALPTMPPNVLAVLPQLPDGLDYRVVGRHLILRDTRANIIVDYVFDVMCATC